jgi:hypothetical protein
MSHICEILDSQVTLGYINPDFRLVGHSVTTCYRVHITDRRQRHRLQLAVAQLQLNDMVNADAVGQLAVAQIRQRLPRRWWVKEWIARRPAFAWYETLTVELEIEDPSSFKNLLGMEPAMYHEMVERLRPLIQKQNTFFRKSLCPGLRLAITLV